MKIILDKNLYYAEVRLTRSTRLGTAVKAVCRANGFDFSIRGNGYRSWRTTIGEPRIVRDILLECLIDKITDKRLLNAKYGKDECPAYDEELAMDAVNSIYKAVTSYNDILDHRVFELSNLCYEEYCSLYLSSLLKR